MSILIRSGRIIRERYKAMTLLNSNLGVRCTLLIS